jgi:hypothetical protein
MGSRNETLQQIYARLASLEAEREEKRIQDQDVSKIDFEMTALRLKLQETTNSPCPLIKEQR